MSNSIFSIEIKQKTCSKCHETKLEGEFVSDLHNEQTSLCLQCSRDLGFSGSANGPDEMTISMERKFLKSAHKEGRLHPDDAALLKVRTGNSFCPLCGMRHWTEAEADVCCTPAGWGRPAKKSKIEPHLSTRIIDKRALYDAVLEYMAEHDIPTLTAFAREIGINREWPRRLLLRNPKWILPRNMVKLLKIFPGGVPGVKQTARTSHRAKQFHVELEKEIQCPKTQ